MLLSEDEALGEPAAERRGFQLDESDLAGNTSRSATCDAVAARSWCSQYATTASTPDRRIARPSRSMAYVFPTPGAIPRYVSSWPLPLDVSVDLTSIGWPRRPF